MVHLGSLLTGALEQLFTLLARLFAQFIHLPFSFLANGRSIHQLFPLLLRLLNDLLSLLLRSRNEFVTLLQELIGLPDLSRKGVTNGIKQFNGILFVDQAATTERNAAALEQDLLQLVELVENRKPYLAHRFWAWKGKLKSLVRSCATTSGTMWLTGPPNRATSFTTELLKKLW